jgi:hypothetical protein
MAEKTEDSSSGGEINDIRGEERDLETIGQVKSRFLGRFIVMMTFFPSRTTALRHQLFPSESPPIPRTTSSWCMKTPLLLHDFF